MLALPIDPTLPEIVREVTRAGRLVLEAPPGAGKTTRVPVALSASTAGEVIVSEPRRLAARLAAQRVASELGERVGERVGYSVRFEDVSSTRTRIRYVTEGVLLRRLIDDPQLRGVGTVVLDEFHERHLATDLVLALLARLLHGARPDLRLVVMSATLDGEPIARFLGDAPRVVSEGRCFDVTIEHLARPDDRPLEKQVVSAVKQALAAEPDGDVLVFLPGAGDIRRAQDALAAVAQSEQLLVLPLHGDLSIDEQTRAVERAARRKVVLSTNVAESSVTIDGVTAVIDSGLVRVAAHSPWTGLPSLVTRKISRASATQRAGRAGRTRAGRVLRLYTAGDLNTRPERDTPELLRAELSETCLLLRAAGVDRLSDVRWLDAPPASAIDAAETLLARLGALDDAGHLTTIGKRMATLPVAPRLARLILGGASLGVAEEATLVAALLSERDLRLSNRTTFGAAAAHRAQSGSSDLMELVDRFDEAASANFDARRLNVMGVDVRTARAVDRAFKKLRPLVKDAAPRPGSPEALERAVGRAVLAAFSDRIAGRRQAGGRDLVLAAGGTAKLAEGSVVHAAPLLVAVDVEEAVGRAGTVVRLASAIDADWLLEDGLVQYTDSLLWNAALGRVESVSRMACGAVVIEESRAAARPSAEASKVLAEAARGRGAAGREKTDQLEQLARRLAVLAEAVPEAKLPTYGTEVLGAALEAACVGLVSLAELDGVDVSARLLDTLDVAQRRLLHEEAPTRVPLPGGRSLEVNYEPGKPPWVESRLQDFFGMTTTPRIAKGRVVLTLHLLAPNRRAVQVTSDLDGFWQRHYPTIRRELMRRYPRHAWPEDGRTAVPPAPRR